MCDELKGLQKQKLEHIKRDYDRACSAMGRKEGRINFFRAWYITAMIGYLGWMLKTDPPIPIPVKPLLGAVLLFWIMETFTRAQARCFIKYTLNQADELFSAKKLKGFQDGVEKYTFLDKMSESEYKDLFPKGGKLHRFLEQLVSVEAFVFYLLPLSVLHGGWPSTWDWRVFRGDVVAGVIVFVVVYCLTKYV